MRREHDFKLRLGDEERDDLERRAAEQGIAKADVIREAMGWEPEGLIKPDSPQPPPARSRPKPSAPAGDEDGPGARGIAELTRRLAERGPATP